jgi:hypothetical protein
MLLVCTESGEAVMIYFSPESTYSKLDAKNSGEKEDKRAVPFI